MPNLDVRFRAKAAGVPLWRIAKKMRIGDNTLFRKLRNELSAEEKQEFFRVIQEIATEQAINELEMQKND